MSGPSAIAELLVISGSVQRIKLATRQLLAHVKLLHCVISYCINMAHHRYKKKIK